MKKPLGAIFTPENTASWGARVSGILDLWLQGGTILDPTCGEGSLLFALVRGARDRGIKPNQEMISRLFAMEREPVFVDSFLDLWEKEGLPALPRNNLIAGDFLTTPVTHWPLMDGIFANPPWLTFADLDKEDKESYRKLFIEYGLVKNLQSALWGSSRVDISALIWLIAMKNNLKTGGLAGIFAPLSLFLNTGAHQGFREELTKEIQWTEVWDWGKDSPFPQVSTRCGFFAWKKLPGSKNSPITYHIWQEKSWVNHRAQPWPGIWDPWIVSPLKDTEVAQNTSTPGPEVSPSFLQFTPLALPPNTKVRQGVNTSGANKAFITEAIPEGPLASYFYPLANTQSGPLRYIFLPYSPVSGRILSQEDIQPWWEDPWFASWKNQWEGVLRNRKGPFITQNAARGLWWSLLGVGPYTFKPWKVVWEAFGSRQFSPRIAGPQEGKTQIPFQALQAYLGFDTEEEAVNILEKMGELPIQRVLEQSRILDGKSGAQPGRMKVFFTYS